MRPVSARHQNVLSGAIALLLLISAVTVGVKSAFGAFDGGYKVVGSFDAAGQGLLPGSDVKVRGVNVGSVRGIELIDGRAQITMRLHDGEDIPRDAVARIRAKTLFGEKFVDLDLTGTDEGAGPFLEAGDTIEQTEGGFELEAVLADAYPLLQAIDGQELMTVISNLAEGGRGLGEEINRTFVNGAKVSEVFAENNDTTSQVLRDLAALSDQLGDSADDLIGIAEAGTDALPVLNDHEAELIELLQQTGRLSNDVADLLLGHRPFVDAALGTGSDAVQVLYDRRTQVIPVVIGLRQYVQTLTEVIRISVGDGTLMGAVKGVLGSELCAVIPCGGPGNPVSTGATTSAPPAGAGPQPRGTALADEPLPRREGDLSDLLERVLGA
jgi:phospholipid/cholesterol/gamma-HCH transport system substrate-binding protein